MKGTNVLGGEVNKTEMAVAVCERQFINLQANVLFLQIL
jgi:hypothetical protein